MRPIEHIDVLIIGAGPAGMSTALHLVKADPGWTERMLIVEKAVHPREKLCAGGITRLGENVLSDLGLSFEPPHLPIREVRLAYHNRVFAIRDNPVFRVVHRKAFDHWLVQQVIKQRIPLRQGEAVTTVIPHENFVEVGTEQVTFQAKAVVAADGSNSLVRKSLKCHQNIIRKARVLEILTPEIAERQTAFQEGIAVFDFSLMSSGLQGYCWDFPSVVNGEPVMNRGIFDSPIRSKHLQIPLKQAFQQSLALRKRQLSEYPLKGFPIQCFDDDGSFSGPRVLFAGDAAGVDPFFGEGISFALAYGQVAAEAIIDAFTRQTFGFVDYKQCIISHPILKQLSIRAHITRIVYKLSRNPEVIPWFWKTVPFLFRGLAWYHPHYIPITRPRMIRVLP